MDDKIEPSWPDERDEIIDKVQRGEMSPSEAQALVTERKLQSLKREPDLTEFDPLNEPDWTLLMAVTWIAYHSPITFERSGQISREIWANGVHGAGVHLTPMALFVDTRSFQARNHASFEQLCLEEIVSLLRPPVRMMIRCCQTPLCASIS